MANPFLTTEKIVSSSDPEWFFATGLSSWLSSDGPLLSLIDDTIWRLSFAPIVSLRKRLFFYILARLFSFSLFSHRLKDVRLLLRE